MSDIFQEVEEDVRRERYEELWKKYGNYIIALAAVIVLAVAAWQAWQRYDLNRREQASDKYQAALAVAQSGDAAKAETAFAEIAQDASSGYQTLAQFELATAELAQNKRDQAIARLQQLVQSSDALVSNTARLRLAWVIADGAPKPQIANLLQPLTDPMSPWRFAAAEVLAYLDLTQGSRSDAQSEYEKLAADMAAPASLRARANAIATYIKANPATNPTALPAAPPAAPAATPAAPAAQAAPAAARPPAPRQGTPSK